MATAQRQRQPPTYDESQDFEAGLLDGPVPTPFPSLSIRDAHNAQSSSTTARARKQSKTAPPILPLHRGSLPGSSGRTLSSPSANPSFLGQRQNVGIHYGAVEVMSTENLPRYSDEVLEARLANTSSSATERTSLLKKSDGVSNSCMKRSRNRAPTVRDYSVDELIRREMLYGDSRSAAELSRLLHEHGEVRMRAAAAMLQKDRDLDQNFSAIGL
ncbi:hypothetical protein BT69DRAFT_270300 [Atractiella rhizophila]|nr:hypothetical protein BT69DRAFT_270300 [Atractiella rhizophila]